MIGVPAQGLRVQDTRDISPWDILEGVKSNGPLMLSWFGGVRVKRKPLRFEEQRWLLRFHTHQEQFKAMMYQPNFVRLPETVATEVVNGGKMVEDVATPSAVEDDKVLGREVAKAGPTNVKAGAMAGSIGAGGPNQPLPTHTGSNPVQVHVATRAHTHTCRHTCVQTHPHAHTQVPSQVPFPRPAPLPQQVIPGVHMAGPQQTVRPNYPARMPGIDPERRMILGRIRSNAMSMQTRVANPAAGAQYPGGHPMYQQRAMTPNPGFTNPATAQMMILKQHHQRRLMMQQMQQRNQIMQHGQYRQFHPGMQGQMQPMQANPPVPMHHVMRQGGYGQQMMPQQGGMMVPGNQGGMQYPPTGMNTIHRPNMF